MRKYFPLMQCNADVAHMVNLVIVFQNCDQSDDGDNDDDLQALLDPYAL